MKKQSKQFAILLLVLVGLAAVFLGLKQYNKGQSEIQEEEMGVTVVDVESDMVTKLTYDYAGETYAFEKVEDTWYYTDDKSLSITQYMITDMLSRIAPLQAEQVIENVTNMTQYGLAETARTIHYETEGASYILEVGDYNSVSDVYYIRKPSENIVYVVSSSKVSVFEKTLEDLVEEVVEEVVEESGEESGEESVEESGEESVD